MATLLEKNKPAAADKYDAYVEDRLARARKRIRLLDASVALLGLLAGTLLYALVMAVCDRWLVLSPLARQVCFAGYLIAAAVYLGLALVLPLCRRLNPYYAARQLEQAVPDAKNSIVNWLDLHEQKLPAAIRGAVSHRAARDLTKANLEQAISARRAAWMGGITALLFLAVFVALLVFGGGQFFSLLGRTFAPFIETTIATRTQLTIVQPAGGDATVSVGQAVLFKVQVDGRVPEANKPDALKLLFRYQQDDPYEERPLQKDTPREWSVSLQAFQVQNGFWYKITGGDFQTDEHHVTVRSTPLVTGSEVSYHYRPYLDRPDETSPDPNLRAPRGTEVTLTAHTNRVLQAKAGAENAPRLAFAKDCRLELQLGNGKQNVPAEVVPDDPQALRFHFVIDESGKYRLWFISNEEEHNVDPMPYNVLAIRDREPTVEIVEPDKEEITLPANGTLRLKGWAADDIGVVGMTLRLQVDQGPVLQPKPYREGKSFKLADGGYPKRLDYQDFVELEKVKLEPGQPFALQPDMVVHYWLEATDNCDYPRPNTAQSKHLRVKIGPPNQDKQQQDKERQQAQQQQQQHEANQDKQLDQENQKRQQEKEQQNNPQQGEGQQPDKKQGGQDDKGEQKPDDKNANKGEKKNEENDAGQQPQNGQQNKDQELKDQAKKLEQAQKERQEQQQKGQAKEERHDEAKAESKPEHKGGEPQEAKGQCKNCQGGNASGSGHKPGDAEGKGTGGDKNQQKDSGQGKDAGKKGENQQQGSAKGQPQPGADPGEGQGKGDPQQEQAEKSESKGSGKQGLPEQFGQSKGSEQGQLNRENEGQGKADNPDQKPQGDPKDDPKRLTRKQDQQDQENKGTGKESAKKQNGQNNTGSGKSDSGQAASKGETKPAGADQETDKAQAKGEKTEGAGQGDQPKEQTPKNEEVDKLAKKARGGKDEKERKEARDKLEEMARNADDKQAREAARKASDELAQEEKREQEGQPGAAKAQPKQGEQPQQGDEKPAQGKGKPEDQKAEPAQPKEGNNPGQADANKAEAKGDKPEEQANASAKGNGKEQGKEKGTGGRDNGPAREGQNTEVPRQDEQPVTGDPDADNARKAGDLQLENIKKLIEEIKKNPQERDKILAQAGMSRQQFDELEKKVEEKLAAPQQGGALPTTGVRKAETGSGKPNDVKAGNRGQPPPGYVDPAREFSKKLADTKDQDK
jgi:collagen type III alpha